MSEVKFDPAKLSIVDIDTIRPNTWNPKGADTDEFEKIKSGIAAKGLRLPIVVRENEGFEIVDGEQRWRACKALGFKKVIIYNEGQLDDMAAKELTLWYQVQVPFDELMLAGLIKELKDLPGLKIPFTADEIEELAKLGDFDWDKYKKEELVFEQTLPVFSYKVSEEQFREIDEIAKKKDSGSTKEEAEKNEIKISVVTKIGITQDQKAIIMDAIKKAGVKDKGEALTLICGAYLGEDIGNDLVGKEEEVAGAGD